LAAWLQPEPYVSVENCGVLFRREEELRCAWPTVITIVTRDQYGAVVNVPNMKVNSFRNILCK
jgi:E3 ubiquitin-protein ligase MYCBP2